jgi:hypothetical protein
VVNGSILTINGAGIVRVTASQSGNANYAATSVVQSFTILRATLTVTATSVSLAHGQPIPVLTFTVSGFGNGDRSTVVTGTPAESTTATSTSAAGSYPITISQGTLAAANYNFIFVNGTLTITSGAQTITFAALPTVTYGVTPITLTATASSGLPVTYSVAGPAAVNGSILTITGAGPVSVTASQAGNSNFAAATPVIQDFTVLRAVLTVKAENATMVYGHSISSFTYTTSGFVNGDKATVANGTPQEATAATSSSAPGSYPITISQGSLSAANYTFAFVSGTLTISTATQTITFPALPNVTYGVSPIKLAATASSGLPVSYSVTGPASINGTTLTVTGAGTVKVTGSQAGNADYTAATSVAQSFLVTIASQAITFNAMCALRRSAFSNSKRKSR